MDRVGLLLLGLPLFLFCSDLVNLFTPPPRSDPSPPLRPARDPAPPRPVIQTPDPFAPHTAQIRGDGYGTTIDLKFCASCSYRGTAMTMKKMLETSFPGIDVVLANYPPPLPKRLLSKAVPVVQLGVTAIVVAGDHIFPRLGFVAPPPWYYSLRANRFGTVSSIWLLGNVFQSFLQSSGAFEVYCNGDLVFSKLKEHRFPSEIELKDLIQKRLSASAFWGSA